jgi:hypothetical protein
MNNLKHITLLVLLVTVLAAAVASRAQERESAPHLIEPDAAALLADAEAILATANTTYSFDSFTGGGTAEWDALVDEFIWRYAASELVTFDQWLTLYRAFGGQPRAGETDTDDRLIPILIEAWLRENPTDLDGEPLLQFDEFTFEVRYLRNTPGISLRALRAPFDGAMLFHQGFSDSVADHLVIRGEDGRYRVPPLPQRMFGHVIEGGDLNADGEPDFAYVTFSHAGNSFASGSLMVVTWDGDALRTIGELPFSYGLEFDDGSNAAVGWEFVRLDDDGQHEVFGTQHVFDNYNCHYLYVRFYDWQPDGTLGIVNTADTFPDTFPCLLRQAERRAWAGAFADAISLYEAALEAADAAGNRGPMRTYAHLRLGVAYLVEGRAADAEGVFTNLSAPEGDGQTWMNAVRAAYRRDPRALPMCQAIYREALDSSFFGLSGNIEVYDGGFYRLNVGMTSSIIPENISCDLNAVLEAQLADTVFTADRTPSAQLEEAGLHLAGSVNADFDGDGDGDWVVWGDAPGLDPIQFVRDEDIYHPTRLAGRGSGDPVFRSADLRLPSESTVYRVITLPDETQALAHIDAGTDRIAELRCGSCGGGPDMVCVGGDQANFPDSAQGLGDLTIWQMRGGILTPTVFALMCPWDVPRALLPSSESEASTVVDRFVAGEEYGAGEMLVEIRPVLFTWDPARETFVPPPLPTPAQEPIIVTPTQTTPTGPDYPLGFGTYWQVRGAFTAGEYDRVLMMADAALAQTARRDEMFAPALGYYRALTLEALRRPDEAAEQYRIIALSAPETAWGRLAALHIDNS